MKKERLTAASDYIHCLCDYANVFYLEYLETRDPALAEEFFRIATQAYEMGKTAVRERLCPDAGIRKGLAANTFVKYYLDKKQYALAAEKIQESLDAFEAFGDCFLDMASILAKQGILYVRTGNPAAGESLDRAIDLFEKYGSSYSGTYFLCLWTKIELLESEGDLYSALAYSHRTLDYAGLVYAEGHNRMVQIKNKIADLTARIAS